MNERNFRFQVADLRKQKLELMNKSRIVGKTSQQENLEQRLSQIEDMISQTILEKEKRFAQLSQ